MKKGTKFEKDDRVYSINGCKQLDTWEWYEIHSYDDDYVFVKDLLTEGNVIKVSIEQVSKVKRGVDIILDRAHVLTGFGETPFSLAIAYTTSCFNQVTTHPELVYAKDVKSATKNHLLIIKEELEKKDFDTSEYDLIEFIAMYSEKW